MKCKIFLPIVLCVLQFLGHGQSTIKPPVNDPASLGGFFDKVYDKDGRQYKLSDLEIHLDATDRLIQVASSTTCQAGMFVVYYANGSGMESPTNPVHIARRTVVCQVLENISSFLGYNATWPSSVTVDMLVDDIANFVPAPSTPSVSGILGLASAFYAIPSNPSSPNPGIIENQVQKTIISRHDAWDNVSSPILPTGGQGYYHGVMAFNFSNPAYNWLASLTSTASATQLDLYTVILHEVTHALGFASLINSNGLSKFGAANNYYAPYDKFLRDKNNAYLINSTGCNSQYGLAFNTNTIYLQPACNSSYVSDITTCLTACNYNSANLPNMPVYTPDCFEPASSLSHFEDMCYPVPNPSNNNLYFTMSNANGFGINKRFLQEEERKVLCDLGYSVNVTYTSTALNATKNYNTGGSCGGRLVWGQNDGINNAAYTYTAIASAFTVAITGGTNAITSNDSPNTTTVTCVETVYNTGIVSISGNIISFTPLSGYTGPVLLRYVPVDGNGNQGNITYIYGYIFGGNCHLESPCNLVQNGGFENNVSCGNMGAPGDVSCWSLYTINPDLFVRGCNSFTPSANLGNATYNSNPVFDSHNGSPNNAVVGIGGVAYSSNGGSTSVSESIYSGLSTPLISGQAYQLSFWANQYCGSRVDPMSTLYPSLQSINSNSVPLVVSFATSNLPQVSPNSTFPASNITTLISATLNPSFNSWQHYVITFTPNATANYLYIGADALKTYSNVINQISIPGTNFYEYYFLLDDVSILPASVAPVISIPATSLCAGQSYTNLEQYVNIPGGVFTGTGITSFFNSNGTQYDFNTSSPQLGNGLYTITYTYTDNLSCPQTAYTQITISNISNSINVSYSGSSSCSNTGTLAVISPTAGYTYTWQPMNSNLSPVTVTTNAASIYTVYASNSNSLSCSLTNTILVLPNIPNLNLSSPNASICIGGTANLMASGSFSSVVWQPGGFTTTAIAVSPTTTSTYTATATSLWGCVTVQTFVVYASPPSQFTLTANPTLICPGSTATLSAQGNYASISWPFTGSIANTTTVNPLITTTYSALITNSLGCSATGTVQANVNGNYTVTSSAAILCSGQSASLSLAGTYTSAVWQPGNLTGSTVVVSPTATTVYTITVTNAEGCVTTMFYVVNLYNLNIQATSNTICAGGSATLSVYGTFTAVIWQPMGVNSNYVIITPSVATTYTATGYTSGGCVITQTVAVNVVSLTLASSSTTLCAGSNLTLTAGGPFTSFAWLPTSLSGSLIVVTPTINTTYTVVATSSLNCSTTRTISIGVQNVGLSFSPNSSCPNNTATITASGNYTSLIWAPGGSTSNTITAPVGGGITYTATASYSNGCVANRTFQLLPNDILPNYQFSIPSPGFCPGKTETITVTGTPSFTALTWQPGNFTTSAIVVTPTAPASYTVTFNTVIGCALKAYYNFTLSPCCSVSVNALSSITQPVTNLSGVNAINFNLQVPQGATLNLTGEVQIAPGTTILLGDNAVLNINSAHLYSCGNAMWNGIVVNETSRLYSEPVGTSNLIEDAKAAISAQVGPYNGSPVNTYSYANQPGTIHISNTIFNKNYISVTMSNCPISTSSNYNFSLNSTVFTCRNLPFTSTTWPQAGTASGQLRYASSVGALATPYSLNSYSVVNLKTPYATQSSSAAVSVSKMGTTMNFTSTVYALDIGDGSGTQTTFNLFDSHNTGIDAHNSHVNSYNNVFQNSVYTATANAAGISHINNLNLNNPYYYYNIYLADAMLNLVSPISPTLCNNRFYNCHTGLYAAGAASLNVKYAIFASTQSTASAASPTVPGYMGISIVSNKFDSYQVHNNQFLNVNVGMNCQLNPNYLSFSYQSPNQYGERWGTFSCTANFFSGASTTTASLGSGYMAQAIIVDNPLTTSSGGNVPTFYAASSVNGLKIMYNSFDRVQCGVQLNGLNGSGYTKNVTNNSITLQNNPSPGATQWGIKMSAGNKVAANSNTVVGTNTVGTNNMAGVYSSMNTNSGVQCNSVVTLPRGFELVGYHPAGLIWTGNKMNANGRGMQATAWGVASSGAGIGVQGSNTAPRDNQWQGTAWNGTSAYQTWSDGSTNVVNSKYYGRSISGYSITPAWNNGAIPNQSYNFASNSSASTANPASSCLTINDAQSMRSNCNTCQLSQGSDEEETETTQIADFLMFLSLDKDSLITSQNDTLLTWYEDNTTQQLGVVKNIETTLAAGDFKTATGLINSFSPETNVENNYKSFFTLYLTYSIDTLKANDKTELQILASQCPFSDGPAIYKARALYNLAYNAVEVYNDDECAPKGYSQRQVHITQAADTLMQQMLLKNNEAKKISKVIATSYKIYPNPANEYFYVKGKFSNEKLSVKILDINGRIIQTNTVETDGSKSKIFVDLINGVYLIQITNQENEIFTKKLVISK